MSKNSKRTREQKRQFLLSFFDNSEKYEEKEVNGFWLVKCFDANRDWWQVAIYSQESFNNYKYYVGLPKQEIEYSAITNKELENCEFAHYKHIYGKSFLATQDTNGKFFEVELKKLKKGYKVVPKEKTQKLL